MPLRQGMKAHAARIGAEVSHGCRLVHPDKCSHPQAKDASAVLNQAYDTLSNSVKKSLYDRCMLWSAYVLCEKLCKLDDEGFLF